MIDEPVFRLLLLSVDNELHSALHWAVICQELGCLELLLETIEQFEQFESNESSKTTENSKQKHPNDLNESGINLRDIHGATCLHYASMLSAKSKFFDLVSEETKINRQEQTNQRKRSDSGMIDGNSNSSGYQNRLKSADKKIALKILNKLLHSKNVLVNIKDNDGRTPLMWSARLGENKAIKELLNANADVNAQDNEGRTGELILFLTKFKLIY